MTSAGGTPYEVLWDAVKQSLVPLVDDWRQNLSSKSVLMSAMDHVQRFQLDSTPTIGTAAFRCPMQSNHVSKYASKGLSAEH